MKVVLSDTRVELHAEEGETPPTEQPQGEWMKYDVLPNINQNEVRNYDLCLVSLEFVFFTNVSILKNIYFIFFEGFSKCS